jgi:uncharacterized membrane protein
MTIKPLNEASKIPKKTKTLMEKSTDFISWFLGSWWAVIFHTVWFSIWLIFNFDINLLTFSVSLEAIFIGIFLLMAANKAEIRRDLHEARLRKRDRESLEHDIKLDERADRQLVEIKRGQKELAKEIKKIRKKLNKL